MNAADFFREDGKPVVDPVTQNPMLGTYTDGSKTQVFQKSPNIPGNLEAMLRDILAGVNQIKKHFAL
jgi:hypothetical protein